MAVFRQRELGLEEIGGTVNIPNDDRARLMYYLDCVCDLVPDLRGDPTLNRLTKYRNYYLNGYEIDQLVIYAYLLSPDELAGRCMFQSDELCGNCGNQFYNINEVTHLLAVAGSILVGGQNKRVQMIMTFKMSWIMNNWANPIKRLAGM